MRIKLLVARGKFAEGEFATVDDAVGKSYIDGGYAEAAPLPDNSTVDDAIQTYIEKALSSKLESAVKSLATKQADPSIRIDSIEDEFKGLKIFGSNGGFFHAVKEGCASNPTRDSQEKLAAWSDMQRKCGVKAMDGTTKTPSGNFEGNDPDGGALVLPEFSQKIVERALMLDNYLAETDNVVIRGNSMQFPALDDASRANGSRSGGILGAYADEADQLSQVSKAKFRTMDMRLKKLYVFAYMTDELLSDSPFALETYLASKCAAELVFKQNDGLINGNGAGVPLGIIAAPGTQTVTAEVGQSSANFGGMIMYANIEKMWQNMTPASRANAVWLYNLDLESQFQYTYMPTGISGTPTFLQTASGAASQGSFPTLKGRPMKPSEFCSAGGTAGDIILVDWSQYQSITKGGIKTDMSMHVRFQYGEMAYRFTYRFDAMPKIDKPMTPYKGSTNVSPYVILASR